MQTSKAPLLARINWYWPLQLLGWSGIIGFVMLANGPFLTRPGAVATCILDGVAGLLLTDLWRRFLKGRRWNTRAVDWRQVAVALLVLGPLQTACVALIARVLLKEDDSGSWLPMLLLFWTGVMMAWQISYMAATALRRANRFESEALRLDVLAKDAELKALQAQVNPHFFFNSLNSVRALIFENQESAARMVDQLATLMRYTLASSYADTVPLKDELEAVQAYLAIEKIRFEERLSVALDIAPGMETVAIPPMSLQTLVENAVKYGVERSSSGSEIRISARHAGGRAAIEVANRGALAMLGNSTRIGLGNARKRLLHAKGGDASLELVERDGWVRATLDFPLAA
ncbi:sensor histidine kinase [Pseudoduganella sp. DS3]|uniref:Sensor histidine kinase n=1 Tax=Pseudoduganella guangdongensis TaxID=2692179 RepID=A0A6N9HNL1_9BURK|nr:histidine kinase [Pseudoduganella guangdongensis]MYN05074.1 sensor histidine kinase [Pseudoduganella guangdongensis]